MAHWRHLFDNKRVGAWDLEEGDVAITIDRVNKREEVVGRGGRKDIKPVIYAKDAKKGVVCGITNCKSIERATGASDPDEWVGKRIILYGSTAQTNDGEVPAVRIRSYPPRENVPDGRLSKQDEPPPPSPVAEDPDGPDGVASGNEGLAGKL